DESTNARLFKTPGDCLVADRETFPRTEGAEVAPLVGFASVKGLVYTETPIAELNDCHRVWRPCNADCHAYGRCGAYGIGHAGRADCGACRPSGSDARSSCGGARADT